MVYFIDEYFDINNYKNKVDIFIDNSIYNYNKYIYIYESFFSKESLLTKLIRRIWSELVSFGNKIINMIKNIIQKIKNFFNKTDDNSKKEKAKKQKIFLIL